MRDKNQSIQEFMVILERELSKVPKKILDLRNQIVVNPNLHWENLRGFPKKKNELLGLILLSKFFPEEIYSIIQIELEEKVLHYDFETRKKLTFYLILSKEQLLLHLCFEKNFSDRDFFGNILREGRKGTNKLHFFSKRYSPIYPQRRRGYNDHGSRRPDFKWLPSKDYSFDYYQKLKELKERFLTLYLNNCQENIQRDLDNLEKKLDLKYVENPNYLWILREKWDQNFILFEEDLK